jgi:hypothetical protein
MLKKKQIEATLSPDEKRPRWISDGMDHWIKVCPAKRYFNIIGAINDAIVRNAIATVNGDNITLKYAVNGVPGEIKINVAKYPQIVVNEIIDIIFPRIDDGYGFYSKNKK